MKITNTKAEKLADKIAIGKRKIIYVQKDEIEEVGKIFEKKYKGTFTYLCFEKVSCIRDKSEPLELRKSWINKHLKSNQ